MKETKGDTQKWKAITCYRVGRINIVKMPTLTKAKYWLNATFMNIPITIYTEGKKSLKYFKTKEAQNS